MKTITEFNGFSLRDAFQKKTAITKDVTTEVTAQGKSGDELAAAVALGVQEKLGAELKLEGDKLKHFLAALEVIEGREGGLKRVVVLSLAEGEKAPAGTKEKEGNHYLAEYFPAPVNARKGRDRDRGGREGRGKGGKGGRDKKRGGRGGGRDRDARKAGGRPNAGGPQGQTTEDGKKLFDFKKPGKPQGGRQSDRQNGQKKPIEKKTETAASPSPETPKQ